MMLLKRQKSFRGSYKPHVCKTSTFAIMKRSRLKNNANKTQLPNDKQNYEKQRNLITKVKQVKQAIFKKIFR